MNISKDYSYINGSQRKLIDAGYGKISVHSIHFDRYVSEEQKEANRRFFDGMTEAERSAYYASDDFENVQKAYAESLADVLNYFIGKFDIHQVSPETSTSKHYNSDWDLFFYSNRGWNGKDYMSYFSLTFNDKRTPDKNMAMLENIIAMLENIESDKVHCRIQYDAVIDDGKVSEAADKAYQSISGKFIPYCGYVGKVKIIRDENGIRDYGFFKKGASKKYYAISNADLLVMCM